ncbi:MAG: HAD family hydrolase [Proteobacteria bacterium]|nr:HAD family hydrolase [Pseudomonadota bacterium]
MLKKIKSIQFDLDGTLIDSIEVYYQLVALALKELRFPQVERSIILDASRSGNFDWAKVLPGDALDNIDHHIKAIRSIITKEYPQLFREKVKVFPGVHEKLNELRTDGIKLAIVTSTPGVNMTEKLNILESSKIKSYFSAIITTDNIANQKPSPDGLLLAAKKLGTSPKLSAYVGDMRSDIEAGQAAMMKTVAVLTGFENRSSLESCQPDFIVPSVADI